uniref:C2H2-type domain-containing protein n=1 Tax=Strigamia maritima TaxID=126957 RepID=T1IK77_STRMM
MAQSHGPTIPAFQLHLPLSLLPSNRFARFLHPALPSCPTPKGRLTCRTAFLHRRSRRLALSPQKTGALNSTTCQCQQRQRQCIVLPLPNVVLEGGEQAGIARQCPGDSEFGPRRGNGGFKKRGSREAPRYQCSDCSKSYSTMSGLSKHQQFHCVTQAKKSFGCKYCDKVYVSLGALKMHIRTHTLPCKCKLCGKAFSRPWLLQGHVRTHTGEKPFACQHCNRAFADRSNLRAHLQTHSDVKKYSCKSCSKTFSRMSLLLKHEDGGCSGSKDEGMMTQVPR